MVRSGSAVVDRLDEPRPAAHLNELTLLNPHFPRYCSPFSAKEFHIARPVTQQHKSFRSQTQGAPFTSLSFLAQRQATKGLGGGPAMHML